MMTAADRPALRALIRAARTQADLLRGAATRPEVDVTAEVTAKLWQGLADDAEKEATAERPA